MLRFLGPHAKRQTLLGHNFTIDSCYNLVTFIIDYCGNKFIAHYLLLTLLIADEIAYKHANVMCQFYGMFSLMPHVLRCAYEQQ